MNIRNAVYLKFILDNYHPPSQLLSNRNDYLGHSLIIHNDLVTYN